MCCSPPHPCCWAVARAVRESFLGGLCTHSHPHQPLRQPLQLSREQCQDGTCTGQGHRGLRWEGAGVCVPPGTSARGPELTPGTAPPTPRKPGLALPDTPHSPKRFLTKLDACGCCHPHPGAPPYWRGRQRPDPPQPLHHPWGQLGLYKLEGVGVPTHRKQLRPSYLITQVLGPAGHRAGGAESFPPSPCLASTPRHAHVQCPRVSGPPPPPHVRTPRRAPGARSVLGPAAGSTDGDSPRPGAA